ncbi:hypothetical protein ABID23_000958 [Bartonella silvatica]|uniref:Uncharacterized protein n=1 Tax=Bartonella silvatica TaxID=357760 RepID=A0ABV2HH33_9HYPH
MREPHTVGGYLTCNIINDRYQSIYGLIMIEREVKKSAFLMFYSSVEKDVFSYVVQSV